MDQDDKDVTVLVAENETPPSSNKTEEPADKDASTPAKPSETKDNTALVAETTTSPPSTNKPEETVDKDASKVVEPLETDENSKSDEPATPVSETPANGTNGPDTDPNDSKTSGAENVDDFTDAMMENLQENFNQDVDNMVSLMESAEEFMFESDDKQLNIKAAIEANERKKEQESKSVINSDKSEAYSLLAQGKRNLFVKDYESAVSTLGEACQKLNSIYGDFAVELADAYMTYGNALLELWRVEEADKKINEDENGEVIENVQDGNEDDEENDDDETEANESENKSDENKENEEGDEDKEDDENSEEKNEEGEEDIENEDDNLQIAWEVVELAKEIYTRHNDNVNAAKAYLKLGEISIASGNYVLSAEDLNRSLDIQKNLNPVDNRLKANTHFNLYVAYSASHNYDKSAEHLDIAKSVFETQVYDLSQKLKTIDKSNTAEISKLTKEINDTEEIIRDMDSKVLENNKHKREFMTALFEAIKNKTSEAQSHSNGSGGSHDGPSSNNLLAPNTKNLLGSTSGPSSNNLLGPNTKNLLGGTSSSNVPVNNISNLIRKKPKEKVEPASDTSSTPSKPNTTVTLNGKSSPNEKIVPNSNSESTASANGDNTNEKQDNQELNGRKRKASESCDESPKKVCLEKE